MDSDLLQEGITAIRDGAVAMDKLMKMAAAAEVLSAKAGAVCACLLDGTLYTKHAEKPPVIQNIKDFAELHSVLKMMKDAASEIEKTMARALGGTDERAGNDGHTQRFAERMREMGLTSVKIDDLGTCYIKTKEQAIPPSKKAEETAIEIFAAICQSKGFELEAPKTTLKDAQQFADDNATKVPAYTAFRLYLRDNGLTQESWNWMALQKHVEELGAVGLQVPDFIKVVKREEVVLRRA